MKEKLKVIAMVEFQNGQSKKIEELNKGEVRMLARQINSSPAKAMGYKADFISEGVK